MCTKVHLVADHTFLAVWFFLTSRNILCKNRLCCCKGCQNCLLVVKLSLFLYLKLEFDEERSASVEHDLWIQETSVWHSCWKNHWSKISQTHRSWATFADHSANRFSRTSLWSVYLYRVYVTLFHFVSIKLYYKIKCTLWTLLDNMLFWYYSVTQPI